MTESNRVFVKRVIYTVIFIILALFSATIFFAVKYFQVSKGQSINQEEKDVNNIIQHVGKLLVLPTNEVPTVATVTNLEALKDQPFFRSAEIGDKVLIYTKSAKGILYRPDKNIIVEVAPLTLEK